MRASVYLLEITGNFLFRASWIFSISRPLYTAYVLYGRPLIYHYLMWFIPHCKFFRSWLIYGLTILLMAAASSCVQKWSPAMKSPDFCTNRRTFYHWHAMICIRADEQRLSTLHGFSRFVSILLEYLQHRQIELTVWAMVFDMCMSLGVTD